MINMLILFLSVRTEKYIPPASKTSGSFRPRAVCETSAKYFYTFRTYKPVNNIYIYIYIYIWRIDQENCSIYKAIKSCWKWFLQEDKVYLSWYHCCLCVIKSTGTHLFYFWRQVWKCLWVCRFTWFRSEILLLWLTIVLFWFTIVLLWLTILLLRLTILLLWPQRVMLYLEGTCTHSYFENMWEVN